jgi:hypothetical protein
VPFIGRQPGALGFPVVAGKMGRPAVAVHGAAATGPVFFWRQLGKPPCPGEDVRLIEVVKSLAARCSVTTDE